jgi:ABC-type sugar transport system ATPase subunit
MTDAGLVREEVLTAVGLSKRYGSVVAAEGIHLTIRAGEVLALIGDNGAGKSTLIKMLSGAVRPDSGEIRLRGKAISFTSPHEARSLGIEAVWQDLGLATGLDVAGNLYLGREIVRGRLPRLLAPLHRKKMASGAAEHLKTLKIDVSRASGPPVGSLSGGQQQAVAVARGAAWATGVLFMDEPTAALGVKQSAAVLALARRLAELGVAVVIITHAIPHVLEVADRIAVLRQGRLVAELRRSDATEHKLVSLIVGFDQDTSG